MMPQLLTVRVKHQDHRPIRVWVPVLPAVLVLSPLVALAVLAVTVACLVYDLSVVRALSTGWRIFSALPGTIFDIEFDRTAVLVAIR
ncbi:hypothetical protein ABZ912_52085 [Nonomuraea angiospora]|uniref:hypothetical protein n=1 Tax=Nonomuraea angiospora TaxID=46172 RepID=UPI0033DB66F0